MKFYLYGFDQLVKLTQLINQKASNQADMNNSDLK